jgi:hypothetical protein
MISYSETAPFAFGFPLRLLPHYCFYFVVLDVFIEMPLRYFPFALSFSKLMLVYLLETEQLGVENVR